MTRELDFSDGQTSASEPAQGLVTTTGLRQFANEAAAEAAGLTFDGAEFWDTTAGEPKMRKTGTWTIMDRVENDDALITAPPTNGDNEIPRWNGTNTRTLQSSGVTLTDADVLNGVTQANIDNIRLDGNTISSTDAAGNLILTPDTTGNLVLDGLNWPQADGTGNQIIETDGGGQLSFVNKPVSAASILASNEVLNLGIAATVGASALTIAIKDATGADATGGTPVKIGFRNLTITNGTFNERSITAALSLVISSGSTLGHLDATTAPIYVYLIDNAGTLELAASATLFKEGGLISTTTEGGAGGADIYTVVYSTTGRTDVPFRVVGKLVSTQTTAGTWAAIPDSIELLHFAKGSLLSEADSQRKVITASIEYAAGVPSVIRQDGSAITSITDHGTGDSTVNLSSGTFSVIPNPMLTVRDSSGIVINVHTTAPPTLTSVRAFIRTSGGGGAADNDYYINMTGPA